MLALSLRQGGGISTPRETPSAQLLSLHVFIRPQGVQSAPPFVGGNMVIAPVRSAKLLVISGVPCLFTAGQSDGGERAAHQGGEGAGSRAGKVRDRGQIRADSFLFEAAV